jgi:CRISPR/Cas system-associated exonuclease Cas4 (RecB family)
MTEWEISEKNVVKPEHLTPIGFSTLRYLRECPLHFVFSRDKKYPQKVHPKARMGIAFHETLAFFVKESPASLSGVIAFFHSALSKQRDEALRNYRERRLSWARTIREACENALAARFHSSTGVSHPKIRRSVENTLMSRDNLAIGRPDEVLMTDNGCIIVDYKTGRSSEETVDYSEEQIHFYAGLWREIRGDMPVSGRIEFLLDNHQHNFSIDQQKANSLVREARSYARALQESRDWLFQAKFGRYCRLCDYRPWCAEYWRSLDSDSIIRQSDLDGLVCPVHPCDSRVVCIARDTFHIMIVNRSVEPLPPWTPGARIRALDLEGTGTTRFRAFHSELFHISSEANL